MTIELKQWLPLLEAAANGQAIQRQGEGAWQSFDPRYLASYIAAGNWSPSCFRIAPPEPKTRVVTVEIPEPMTEYPEDGSDYWVLRHDGECVQRSWRDTYFARDSFIRGIWRTKEEAVAANVAWVKALGMAK